MLLCVTHGPSETDDGLHCIWVLHSNYLSFFAINYFGFSVKLCTNWEDLSYYEAGLYLDVQTPGLFCFRPFFSLWLFFIWMIQYASFLRHDFAFRVIYLFSYTDIAMRCRWLPCNILHIAESQVLSCYRIVRNILWQYQELLGLPAPVAGLVCCPHCRFMAS